MAKLTMAQRKALPKSDFAVPSKAPGPGSFPIPDKNHALAAQGLKGNASKANQPKVQAKASAKLGKPAAKAKKK